jgi:hypothetical protein
LHLVADETRGERITEDELEDIAKQHGYQFQDNEKAEYTQLLRATTDGFQSVSEMEGEMLLALVIFQY